MRPLPRLDDTNHDDTPAAIAGNLQLPYTSLRLKMIVIIAATLLCLLIILYIPLRLFVLGSFDRLQEQAVGVDVERAGRVLADDLVSLDRLAVSYGSWDDTYRFVKQPGSWYDDFVTSNVFVDNQINLLLIADYRGRVLYSRAYDLDAGRAVAPPAALADLAASPLLRHRGLNSSITGVVMLQDDPMLVASRPILDSAGQGPSQGVLVVGRLLNAVEQQRLAELTRLDVGFQRLDQGGLNRDLQQARLALLDGAPKVVLPLSDASIAGYLLIRDLNDQPSLLLRATVPRRIYMEGLNGAFSFSLAMTATAVIFGIVMMVLLERAVLSRLTSLSSQVDAIGTRKDPTARVELSGNDELNHLAERINGMLDALEQTRQRQREEEERAQLQEQSLRARREFISTVSHELRTPLTPINGFVDLLMLEIAGSINAEQRSFLQTIKDNTDRMTALVNDLLEVGRIEAGRIELHRTQLNVRHTIDEVVALLQPALTSKQMELSLQIAPDLPAVDADSKRVGQVLINLLSNAIKYTQVRGRIIVRAHELDAQVEIQVEDTGVGLSAEQLAMLFTPFYRADSPLRDEVGGTGLGLSIAKSFVELHGGTIWVRSEPGVGSVFGFTLPSVAAPPAQLRHQTVGAHE